MALETVEAVAGVEGVKRTWSAAVASLRLRLWVLVWWGSAPSCYVGDGGGECGEEVG
jgi:hypothetical protein